MDINKVFDYVNKVSPWPDDTSDEVIFQRATQAVSDMLLCGSFTKQKTFYRLAGQSGCGKTTQLLPTLLEFEQGQGNYPVVVAVRNFYKYHPRFAQFQNELPHGELRERTNGFSLKCVAVAIKQFIERGFLVILDMTILDPIFEAFVNQHLQSNRYKVHYHILAVSKHISDALIDKRKSDTTSSEVGKVVHAVTKDYFFDILPKGLSYLASVDKTGSATVWTVFNPQPIYHGELNGVCVALQQGRDMTGELRYSEEELRISKLKWLTR